MGHHLTESGAFKSDKYDWCPEGFLALKFTDPHARAAMLHYATLTRDADLAADLVVAVSRAEAVDGAEVMRLEVRQLIVDKMNELMVSMGNLNAAENSSEGRTSKATYEALAELRDQVKRIDLPGEK